MTARPPRLRLHQPERRALLAAVERLVAFCVTHCAWCEKPVSEADFERGECPHCKNYLDPFR